MAAPDLGAAWPSDHDGDRSSQGKRSGVRARAAAPKWPVPIAETPKLRIKRKVAAVHEKLEQLRQTHGLRAASEGMKVPVRETRSRPPLETDHRGVNLLQRISSKPNPDFKLL
jgi:hypothetical protein